MNLQLSLKMQWFELTKSGVKTEDYRELNEYWCNRLIYLCREDMTFSEFVKYVNGKQVNQYYADHFAFKTFTTNTMTLGYPKSTDSDRILKYEHAGVEIREGNPAWGAEEGKLYFVIKHGNLIK